MKHSISVPTANGDGGKWMIRIEVCRFLSGRRLSSHSSPAPRGAEPPRTELDLRISGPFPLPVSAICSSWFNKLGFPLPSVLFVSMSVFSYVSELIFPLL